MHKQHNQEAGYRAERMNPHAAGRKVVIYEAEAQGIDVCGCRYAVVCDAHANIGNATSMPQARGLMKHPEDFCTDCRAMAEGAPRG